MSINICFIYLGTPVLGAYMLMSIVSSSCIDHFYHYIIPSLYFVTDLCFKCILSHTSIATPTFLLFPFAWNIFFHPFTFSLCVSLVLKWVSYKQQAHRSYFIQSAILCLLIGSFSSLTFKTIIDRYVLIAIILLVFQLFCGSSLFFCSSSSYFPGILMIFFSGMFVFLSLLFLCIYCRFLICGYHGVHICSPISVLNR